MRLSCFALAAPLWAHAVSMSTGELRVDGPLATYELRIPMYEVAPLPDPPALIDHIRFAGARRTSAKCRQDEGTYVCVADYEFPGLIDRVDVECTFFQITVPNHVHLLRVVQGPNSDQAVFDQSFPREVVRFLPPSRMETLAREFGGGIWRALASPAALFLLILIFAGRSGSESALLVVMYLAGEWIMRPIAPRIPWPLSPRFIEAAMALTVAYLALEILTLPDAGKRWIVVFVLGLFHGLYFAAFPAGYLAGAALMQAAVLAILITLALKFAQPAMRRAGAGVLLAAGVVWFAVRLIRPI
ncbi:MAG TPA: HupE/UreJ family protein [Bryobacteraceae bacterium]|nr:HupE/UreJ family protein [Bryobacteraceae bacterium]